MRPRLLFAGGLGVLLAVLTVVLVALSGGEERSFAAPPAECVEAWNRDSSAVFLGKHQYAAHGYANVEVLRLRADGTAAAAGDAAALCAIVFAAGALDPELSAAAQVRRGKLWGPLSTTAPEERLASLQAAAESGYNAKITDAGTIEPL